MISLLRSPARAHFLFFRPSIVWSAVGFVLAATLFILLRACSYVVSAVAVYGAYLGLYVVLPGLVVMSALNRGPLSLTAAIALGLPTGFAIEIFSFIGLAAAGLKEVYAWLPLFWVVMGALLCVPRRSGLVRWRLSPAHAWIALWLGVLGLGAVAMAASQMFAESPLAAGLPTRAIFHDWVYLVSRAAVIKNNWPFDDPSLSGTPLQYHYFMMVHAAAASWTTHVELTLVLLRLMIVPLCVVLVVQAYALGRWVSRSPWGGVVAAVLLVVSEASFSPSYGQPMFLGLFVRWLFVSPTLLFGLIFCGALLLAVARCTRLARCNGWHFCWLFLLAAAGTGAKGTVLPVMVLALGLWAVWRWWSDRRFPVRIALFGVCLGLAFVAVYWVTMSSWGSGDARFNPLHILELTAFWKAHRQPWELALATMMPVRLASAFAALGCAAVVFAGTCGVRGCMPPCACPCWRRARRWVCSI